MSSYKTPFSEKCFILGSLWLYYREEAEDDKAWSDFFYYNDIGLPLAYVIAEGIATANENGETEQFIDETWNMLCKYIDVDPYEQYDTVDALFAASPHPRLEQSAKD